MNTFENQIINRDNSKIEGERILNENEFLKIWFL